MTVEELRKTAERALDALLKAGADKAQSHITHTERYELNVASGEISLFRTTFDTRVSLVAIKNGKKGTASTNKTGEDSVAKAAEEALAVAEAAVPDEANDIAEKQPSGRFDAGRESPDREAMYERLREFLDTVRQRYPTILLMQGFLSFLRTESLVLNSNGVDLASGKGVYRWNAVFSARDGGRVSSFNSVSVSMGGLDLPLLEWGSVARLLQETTEQVTTRAVPGKFTGDLLVAPDCVRDMLEFLDSSLRDRALISGTSIYKDSLEKPVASTLLSLHSKPTSPEICDGYFITSDGYRAEDSTLVRNGVLEGFLLSLYGSRKTGKPRAKNDGEAYVVDPGETCLDDMVAAVDRGILLVRFSGGYPSENGDFSGVAKNSYYIENGRIRYPISETMISGNLAECYRNIRAVSRETVNYGYASFPWMLISGVTASGE